MHKKTMIVFTLQGAIGFGIGGMIGGAIWVALDAFLLGFPLMGGIGSLFLSLAFKDWKRTGYFVLWGIIGFSVGFFIAFFIIIALWEPIYRGLFIGILSGGVAGTILTLALKGWERIWLLPLAAALGFGLAGQASMGAFNNASSQILTGALSLAIWGIFGGASAGAALGYLRSINIQTDNN